MSANGLVGRELELEIIEQELDALAHGSQQAVLILGEAGIGKTALLATTVERAQRRGHAGVMGRAAEFERDLPFALFIEALDDALSTISGRDLEAVVDIEYLAPVFSAVAALVPEPRSAAPDERHHVIRAMRSLLARIAADRPVVLALDDLHWADPASADLVCQLLHRPLEAPVLVALSARPHQLDARLAAAFEEAERDGAVRRTEPSPLSADEADALLGNELRPDLRRRLYRESGGNPFYLQQLAAVARRGRAGRDASSRGVQLKAVPPAVAAAIRHELDALPPDALRLAQGAAVAGEPFELELATRAAALRDELALEQLDRLIELDLVRDAGVAGRFRFRHPIVRAAVYESAGAGWRIAAHRRISDALEAQEAPARVRAHHVERSAAVGDLRSVELLEQAGAESLVRAPVSAAHWFDAALRLLPVTAGQEQRRLELLTQRAAALGFAGHLEQARDALRELLKLLPVEPTDVRRRAIVVAEVLEDVLGNHEECHRMLVRELAHVPDPRSAAAMEICVSLSINRWFGADWEGMRDYAKRALEAEASTPNLQVGALATLALGQYGLGELEAAQASTMRSAEIFDALPDAMLSAHHPGIAIWLSWAETCLERYDDAIRHMDRAIAVGRSMGQRHLIPAMLSFQVEPLVMRGRLSEAVENADALMEESLLLGSDAYRQMAMTLRAAVELVRGDVLAAVRFAERGASDGDDPPAAIRRLVLAEALFAAGEPQRCRDVLLHADRRPRLPPIPVYEARGLLLLAQAAIALEDVEDATHCADRLAELTNRFPQRAVRSVALQAHAYVALGSGRPHAAVDAAREAVAHAGRLGSPLGAAEARTLLGEALAATGDRAAAMAELGRAHAELERMGAWRHRDRAAHALRALGRAVAVPRAAAAGNGSFAGLTQREVDVLQRVARGRTNRQIAAELYLSVRTVDRHVSRIFEKLGVSSRAAAVSEFERSRGAMGAS